MTTEIEPTVDEQLYCYGHPKTPTRLRCSRCERPICGRCAIPASVGQHCPECVAEARRSAPRVRTTLAATAPATRAILIATGIVFVAQFLIPGLMNRFGMQPLFIVLRDEYWRLLTPMLVHAGFLHAFMNGSVLLSIGPAVESRFKTLPYTMIYVVSGVGGSVASFWFSGCEVNGVGASGAILGIVGALMADLYTRRDSAMAKVQLRGIVRWVGLIFAIGIALEFVPFPIRIDNFAHGGGLITGVLLGWGFAPDRETSASEKTIVSVTVIVALVVLAIWRIAAFTCGG